MTILISYSLPHQLLHLSRQQVATQPFMVCGSSGP